LFWTGENCDYGGGDCDADNDDIADTGDIAFVDVMPDAIGALVAASAAAGVEKKTSTTMNDDSFCCCYCYR
jgi:hypothetical protein